MNSKLSNISTLALLTTLYALSLMGCQSSKPKGSGIEFLNVKTLECSGGCPVYELSISENGDFTFNGSKNVKKAGVSEGTFTENEMRALRTSIQENDYFQVEINNSKTMKDFPTTLLSVSLNGQSRKVTYYYPENEQLIAILSNVKSLLEVKGLL